MIGFELREYRVEDYMRIMRRKFDLVTFKNFTDPEQAGRNLLKGPGFTGLMDGEIIASGGVVILWKGVGEAWVVSSPLVEKYPLIFAKTIARKLREIIRESGLVRVQTMVDAEHIVSQRWIERMGFVQEGLMRKYLQGRDFWRYALVREG